MSEQDIHQRWLRLLVHWTDKETKAQNGAVALPRSKIHNELAPRVSGLLVQGFPTIERGRRK